MKKIIATALLSSLVGCAWLKSEGTVAESVAVSCAKSDYAGLVSQVASILSAGSGWEAALDALAVKAGSDAVSCAIEVVVAVAEAAKPGSAAPATSELAPGVLAGQAWIVSKHIVLK